MYSAKAGTLLYCPGIDLLIRTSVESQLHLRSVSTTPQCFDGSELSICHFSANPKSNCHTLSRSKSNSTDSVPCKERLEDTAGQFKRQKVEPQLPIISVVIQSISPPIKGRQYLSILHTTFVSTYLDGFTLSPAVPPPPNSPPTPTTSHSTTQSSSLKR